jgi:hypothetical protein
LRKTRMSVVTSVPAFLLKVLLGSRIPPTKSARYAIQRRKFADAWESIVPALVMDTIRPPAAERSRLRARNWLWSEEGYLSPAQPSRANGTFPITRSVPNVAVLHPRGLHQILICRRREK